MRVNFVSGMPLALFTSHLQYCADQLQQVVVGSVRWNTDIERFWTAAEEVSEYTFSGTLTTLADQGYRKEKQIVEVGQFSVRGDLISVWLPGWSDPIRLSYFGDDLEEITSFDILSGKSLQKLETLWVGKLSEMESTADWGNLEVKLPRREHKGSLAHADELVALRTSDLGKLNRHELSEFDYQTPPLFFGREDILHSQLKRYEEQGYRIWLNSRQSDRLSEDLQEYSKQRITEEDVQLAELPELQAGLVSAQRKLAILTDRELFGTIFVAARASKKLKSSNAQKLLLQLEGEINQGDFVVHSDYGVGIYRGFTVENERDYLKLEYAEDDSLFVPLDQIDKLSKYIGDSGTPPLLTRLGSNDWQQIRKQVKGRVAIAAQELARHYAQIQLSSAMPITGEDSPMYQQFCDLFPHELTVDQVRSEVEIRGDLSRKQPMHRLLIGDVGYGKTELIMRAAFLVAEAGGQVTILCPTTVLALQHFRNFSERFADTPFSLGLCGRVQSTAANKKALEDFNAGKVDILIGTHRLLSSDINPKRLGLLVVDEEQRFGVKQKEKLRKLEYGVHSLFVSATPIPRTLSMALASIQDISFINTPPKGRRPVTTHVQQFNWEVLVKAVELEIERGGQVFVVHNRVKTIASLAAQINRYLPGVKVGIAHGQLSSSDLDKVMLEFYQAQTQILLATTIIENGLDLPNVNTIIITDAQRLGLAQMYQLRGRVGRSPAQAFAYFFYSGASLTALAELETARELADEKGAKKRELKYLQRLETILQAQELGGGYLIASRDLELRGAGNLLGREQHGSIARIGYSLYLSMLAEEVEKLKLAQPE